MVGLAGLVNLLLPVGLIGIVGWVGFVELLGVSRFGWLVGLQGGLVKLVRLVG